MANRESLMLKALSILFALTVWFVNQLVNNIEENMRLTAKHETQIAVLEQDLKDLKHAVKLGFTHKKAQ